MANDEEVLHVMIQDGALAAHDAAVARGLDPELAWTAPLWIAMQTARQHYGDDQYLQHVLDAVRSMEEDLATGRFDKVIPPDEKPRWSRWSDG